MSVSESLKLKVFVLDIMANVNRNVRCVPVDAFGNDTDEKKF